MIASCVTPMPRRAQYFYLRSKISGTLGPAEVKYLVLGDSAQARLEGLIGAESLHPGHGQRREGSHCQPPYRTSKKSTVILHHSGPNIEVPLALLATWPGSEAL